MNATELANLTIKELKAIAQVKGIEVAGDKRSKATWVLAIESWQIDRVEIETTPELKLPAVDVSDYQPIESPFELVIKSDSIASLHPALEPNPQVSEQKAPPMREASTVALIAVLVFGVAFLVIKTGFTAFAWVLTALAPLAFGLWRYLVPEPKHQDSIDYFPLPVG